MTTKPMTAPTEEEVRDAVQDRFRRRDSGGHTSLRVEWADIFTDWGMLSDDLYDPDLDFEEEPWTRLANLRTDAIRAVRDEMTLRLFEAVVAATLQFAREHPDAPRAVREPVTA